MDEGNLHTAACQLAVFQTDDTVSPLRLPPFLFCALRSFTYGDSTGRMQQHVEVKYKFNASGKVIEYEQTILWKESE